MTGKIRRRITRKERVRLLWPGAIQIACRRAVGKSGVNLGEIGTVLPVVPAASIVRSMCGGHLRQTSDNRDLRWFCRARGKTYRSLPRRRPCRSRSSLSPVEVVIRHCDPDISQVTPRPDVDKHPAQVNMRQTLKVNICDVAAFLHIVRDMGCLHGDRSFC